VGDGAAFGVGEGQAPPGGGVGGEPGGEGTAGLGVGGAVAGDLAGPVGLAEIGRERQGEVHVSGDRRADGVTGIRSAGPGRVRGGGVRAGARAGGAGCAGLRCARCAGRGRAGGAGGQEGGDRAAVEDGTEHRGPQLLQSAGRAAGLQPLRLRGQPGVGGDDLGLRQLPAGQDAVARRFLPDIHRSVLAGLAPPPGISPGIDRQDRAAQRDPQPRRRHPGRPAQQQVGDGRGIRVRQDAQHVGEDHGTGPVDGPGQGGGADSGQPGQVPADVQDPGRGPAG
jgi:hypothetical protein